MLNQPHTQPLSPSTPPRLLIDRVYEFFTEVKLSIEKFEYDVNSCEGQAVKNLRAAFDEAEKEFDQLRRFSSNFFDSLDNTALRRINSEQAEEIARLKKALAGQDVTEAKETASPENKSPEAKKSGLFAEDNLGQVFGPYKDEEEMRSVFGQAKPARTWWVKEDGDPGAVSVTIKPDMTQPPSADERQLARAAIDRAQALARKTDTHNAYEPPPRPSEHPAVWDLVMKDIQERDKLGEEKYGQRLKPFIGRRPILDLYQELLDAVVYAKQEIYEREKLFELLKEALVVVGRHCGAGSSAMVGEAEAFIKKAKEILG